MKCSISLSGKSLPSSPIFVLRLAWNSAEIAADFAGYLRPGVEGPMVNNDQEWPILVDNGESILIMVND